MYQSYVRNDSPIWYTKIIYIARGLALPCLRPQIPLSNTYLYYMKFLRHVNFANFAITKQSRN